MDVVAAVGAAVVEAAVEAAAADIAHSTDPASAAQLFVLPMIKKKKGEVR